MSDTSVLDFFYINFSKKVIFKGILQNLFYLIKLVLVYLIINKNDILYNKNKIINAIQDNKGEVDLVVFGETFYKGFNV